MARSRRGTLATNLRMRACVTLCHSLCTAARSSAAVLGNGSLALMRLDICDHIFSMILISGLFAGHKRTSIAALARNSWLILAVCGEAPSCMKTALSANTWLSICGSTCGLRMSSIYFCAVRPPWMSTKSSLQSLLTHPHTLMDILPEARFGAMQASSKRSRRRRHTRRFPFFLLRLNEHSSLQWIRFHSDSLSRSLFWHHASRVWKKYTHMSICFYHIDTYARVMMHVNG